MIPSVSLTDNPSKSSRSRHTAFGTQTRVIGSDTCLYAGPCYLVRCMQVRLSTIHLTLPDPKKTPFDAPLGSDATLLICLIEAFHSETGTRTIVKHWSKTHNIPSDHASWKQHACLMSNTSFQLTFPSTNCVSCLLTIGMQIPKLL